MNRTRISTRLGTRWLALAAGLLLMVACTVPQIEVPGESPAPIATPGTPEEEPAAPAGAPLESTVWLLQEYADLDGELQTALEDSDGFILLENDELGGTAGCNSFFGDYSHEDDTLTFGTLGSTLMACDEPLMSQERAVFTALETTASYEISQDTLTLFDTAGNPVAIYYASPSDTPPLDGDLPELDEPENDMPDATAPDAAAPEDLTIENTRWELTHYAADGQLQPAVEDAEAYIELSNGEVMGQTGCNQFTGSDPYELEATTLRFGEIISTLMACLGRVEAQEQAFFFALDETRGYTLENGTLTLIDEDGAPLLVFVVEQAPTDADVDAAPNVDAAATDDATNDNTTVADSEPAAEESAEIAAEPGLEDFTWALAAYRSRHGEWVEPVAPGELHLAAGNLRGNTGCNSMNSVYNTEDGRLSFGVIATTRMGCAPDIAAQEFDVLDALRQVVGYELEQDMLTLLDAEGEAVLAFNAAG